MLLLGGLFLFFQKKFYKNLKVFHLLPKLFLIICPYINEGQKKSFKIFEEVIK